MPGGIPLAFSPALLPDASAVGLYIQKETWTTVELMGLRVSSLVRKKLAEKHNVSESEILECFGNRDGAYLKDPRAEHQTNPPTLWFVAETDFGRRLKIVFILEMNGEITIKTAYQPNVKEIHIYEKYGK